MCHTLQLLKEDNTNAAAKKILDSILDRHNRSNKMTMGDHLSSLFSSQHLTLCSFVLMNIPDQRLEQAIEVYNIKDIDKLDLIYHIQQYHYNPKDYIDWLKKACANNTNDENFELFTLLEPWISNDSMMLRAEANHDYGILNKELYNLAIKYFHPTIKQLKTYFATTRFDPKSNYKFATNKTDIDWINFVEERVQNTINPSIDNIQILCHKLSIDHIAALPEYNVLSNEDKIKILRGRTFTPEIIHVLADMNMTTLLQELVAEMETDLWKNQNFGGMDKMPLVKSLLTNTKTYSQIQKLAYEDKSILLKYTFRYIAYFNDHSSDKFRATSLDSNASKELCVIALLQDEISIEVLRFFYDKYPDVIKLMPYIKEKNNTFEATLAKVLEPITGISEKQIYHILQTHRSLLAHSSMNVLYEQLIHPTKISITPEDIAWTHY